MGCFLKTLIRYKGMSNMCNIAGYVGSKQAAPVLLEMLKKQEGFDSGFYTGIATIHEGKIYYAKVVGDTNTLIEKTNAASLPGKTGIAHSRTPGGVDEENKWAHPFTTEKNGDVLIAQVLNGWAGCWTPREPEYLALAKQLIDEGYPMKSAIHAPGKHWSIDGSISVHTSDVFTQLTAKNMDQGADVVSALRESYVRMPEETVTLMLSVTEPNAIAWGRLNFPMFQATAQDGMYLATSPQALPEEVNEHHMLPAASSGLVYKDHYTCYPFPNDLQKVIGPITPEIRAKAYDIVSQALRESRQTIQSLRPFVKPLFAPTVCPQINALTYDILWDLHQQGRLIIDKEYGPGVLAHLKAPTLYLRLKDK